MMLPTRLPLIMLGLAMLAAGCSSGGRRELAPVVDAGQSRSPPQSSSRGTSGGYPPRTTQAGPATLGRGGQGIPPADTSSGPSFETLPATTESTSTWRPPSMERATPLASGNPPTAPAPVATAAVQPPPRETTPLATPTPSPRLGPTPEGPSEPLQTAMLSKPPTTVPSAPKASSAVTTLIKEADRMRAEGDLGRAASVLERAQRIEPQNPYVWNRLAHVRLDQGRTREAAELAAKSSSLAGADEGLKRDNANLIALAKQKQTGWLGIHASILRAS